MLTPEERARQTYRWERFRSLFSGVFEVLWQPGAAVALLVAIRYYDGDALHKGLISASKFTGFLFTPLTLSLFAHTRLGLTRCMALIFAVTASILLVIPWWPGLWPYVILISLAEIIMVQHLPMNTEMYGTHFTTSQRGHRMSTVFLIGGGVSAATNLITGTVLDARLEYFTYFITLSGICCLGAAACLMQIPSRPLERDQVGHPWRNIGLIWKDRLFGWLLLSWMMLGIGNLMTLPLRIEYMANPRFGIDASNQTILIVTGAVPLASRLLATRLLGKLFDRWNLVTLRMTLNTMFALSMLLFFTTRNPWVLGVSMALLGSAMAGGRIAWTLWVTKLAPPGKTSAYMSVHMVSTGIRGTLAPFLGFYLIEQMDIRHVGYLGVGLSVLSTLMFFPARGAMVRRQQDLQDPGGNPVPEERMG